MVRKSLVYIFCFTVMLSCNDSEHQLSFDEWYTQQKTGVFDSSKKRMKEMLSPKFKIDTIYRSMKGPVHEEVFYLADSGDIIWFTGYNVEVINEQGEVLEEGFMCHNNLNLDSSRSFPWQPKNFHYQNRIFTLTQGVTDIRLPDGYGIPIPAEQGLKIMYQALNHNYSVIDTTVRHRVTLQFFLDSEIDFKMKPVFMQTLWLVKQYEGPEGNMGEKPAEDAKNISSVDNENYHPAQQPTCGVDMLANNEALKGVDMYFDSYGRKYTGHWKIAPGLEEIGMNVTKMLNLSEKRKVVMAFGHVHPYCQKIALVEEKNKEEVLALNMKQSEVGIGLSEIEVLRPDTEIWLSPKSSYTLTSTYKNTGSDTLSAMSVMYVYMEE